MNPFWLMRLKRWVQHPPSKNRMMMIGGVIVFCLILYGIEAIWGWPEALTPNRASRRPRIMN